VRLRCVVAGHLRRAIASVAAWIGVASSWCGLVFGGLKQTFRSRFVHAPGVVAAHGLLLIDTRSLRAASLRLAGCFCWPSAARPCAATDLAEHCLSADFRYGRMDVHMIFSVDMVFMPLCGHFPGVFEWMKQVDFKAKIN